VDDRRLGCGTVRCSGKPAGPGCTVSDRNAAGAAAKASKGKRSLFRCWQGRMIFEGRGYGRCRRSQIADRDGRVWRWRGQGSGVDLYEGLCVLELAK